MLIHCEVLVFEYRMEYSFLMTWNIVILCIPFIRSSILFLHYFKSELITNSVCSYHRLWVFSSFDLFLQQVNSGLLSHNFLSFFYAALQVPRTGMHCDQCLFFMAIISHSVWIREWTFVSSSPLPCWNYI